MRSTRTPRFIAVLPEGALWLALIPGSFLLGLNCVLLNSWLHTNLAQSRWFLVQHSASVFTVLNILLIAGLLVMRWRVVLPWRRAVQIVQNTSKHLTLDASNGSIIHEIARLSAIAQESYRRYHEVAGELQEAQQVIAQYSIQHRAIMGSTDREITEQYRSVLAYANYLEEHIQRKSADPGLRFDFDDVCESSFNLKLIATSLALLRDTRERPCSRLAIAPFMQQMMLALSSSLDRRNMKLTTAEVDAAVHVNSNPDIVSNVLWIVLLGTIRYAEEESTLRMRTQYDHQNERALISIVVSELSPGSMTPEERQEHLRRQMQHLTPHMFAETIRVHAHMQLADLLLKSVDGEISVTPLSAHACEICIYFPAA